MSEALNDVTVKNVQTELNRLSASMTEIHSQQSFLAEQVKMIESSAAIYRGTPRWIQMAYDLCRECPESTISTLCKFMEALPVEQQDNIGLFLLSVAIHRIWRYGAGPALKERYLQEIQDRIIYWYEHSATVTQWTEEQQNMAQTAYSDIWAKEPLEADYTYMSKSEWPFILDDKHIFSD